MKIWKKGVFQKRWNYVKENYLRIAIKMRVAAEEIIVNIEWYR